MPKASMDHGSDTPDWPLSTFRCERTPPGSANRIRGSLAPPPGLERHGIGGGVRSQRNVDNGQSGVSLLDGKIFPKWTVYYGGNQGKTGNE
jgi:hypothetical protein